MPGPVTIELVVAPSVNHAMAHSGLPFCRRIVVSGAPGAELLVTLRVVDPYGTVLSRHWQHYTEQAPADGPLVIDNPAIRLDPAFLAGVEEETSAEIEVEVSAGPEQGSQLLAEHPGGSQLLAEHPGGSQVLARLEHPIRVLPARLWLLDPHAPVLSLELLASFVQPNHPLLGPLIAEAAQRLATDTGSGSLATANVEPARIDQIVAAIFQALHDRQIYYAEPPPSWGYGQQVRTCSDVLGDRIGTCLDTTVVLAAALEHVGIPPVLWIASGHAFLGYWRSPDAGLPDAASTELASAANAVDLELMGVVETTLVTRERRPPRDLFRRAAQAPKDNYFLGGASLLLGVVDVRMARMLRVYPLPVRQQRADGLVEVIEYTPAEPGAGQAALAPASASAAALGPPGPGGAPVPARIQAWKNALLDLTLRNKLLNLDQPMSQTALLLPPEHLGVLADLLQDGKTVSLRAVDDLAGAVLSEGARDAYALPADVRRSMLVQRGTVYTLHAREAHDRALARLRYRARTGREETGANPLMITLGRLEWQLGDRKLSAPLLLQPVDLKGVVLPYRVAADPSGGVTMNLSLLEKLRVEFGFTVRALDPLPLRSSGEGVDVDAAVRLFREALAEFGLAFRVESEARLIIGGFTGFLLWRDLDQHWQDFVARPLVGQLLEGKLSSVPELTAGADLDAVVAAAPIAADGSQATAIAAARAGQSFVLEGPPGTGKSQTITNILADQLAQGRTVLFVAEKGAALDVVRHRLGEVGLAPFALDLHDTNARPAEVRAKLRTALGQRGHADTDAFRAAEQDNQGSAAALAGYADRLHRPNRAGLSLWSARSAALARGSGPSLSVPPAAVAGGAGPAGVDLAGVRRVLNAAVGPLAELTPEVAATWGFAASRPTAERLAELLPGADFAVSTALSWLDECPPAAAALLTQVARLDVLEVLTRLLSGRVSPDTDLAQLSSLRWSAARAELSELTATLWQEAAARLAEFEPEVLGVPLEPVRQELRVAAESFFLGRKGRLVNAAAPVLAHLRPGQRIEPKALPGRVEELAALSRRMHDLLARWRSLPGLGWLPPDANLLGDGGDLLDAGLSALDQHRAALDWLGGSWSAEVVKVRREESPIPDGAAAALDAAGEALAAVAGLTGSRADDQVAFAGSHGLLAAWHRSTGWRRADLPGLGALGRWLRASAAVEPLLPEFPQARWDLLTCRVAAAEAPAAWERGLADASQTERWDAGGFGGFDPRAHDGNVARFLESGAGLRVALRTELPAELIAGRPFRPGAMFGKVAALEREIGRTRGGLSVRALISTYGDVIAAATPCLLVSPDSLARFVAPGAIDFDLVVFDEASQITVADAIGALGRAEACVVAGDSKQMPPYTFGQLGLDEDAEPAEVADFTVIPDEESVLSEFVQAGLPRLWLSWHYRSQDESLISFSNQTYYEGRLSSFPAYPGQLFDTGVSFTRVDGHFNRSSRRGAPAGQGVLRTNPIEAAAVVEEVLRRWHQRERSIGVVTFNIQQRGLVEQMLWESGVEGVAEALALKDDGLFVKNLENVQGDERDVIIFSTGFSVDDRGVLPLNFGPLNRSGGERRLNVAVTRARRRVMVFSSFEPEDIRADQTSSVGIKHLRAYLELARDGVAPRVVDDQSAAATDRHADQIAGALVAAGCTVTKGVGLSDFRIDLAVAAPGRGDRPTLAVLLDGPAWAARVTVGDRDGVPASVLRDIMGWPGVARVWLPAWLSDPQGVVRDLLAQAEASANVPRTVGESQVSAASGAGSIGAEPGEQPAPAGSPADSDGESPEPTIEELLARDEPLSAEPDPEEVDADQVESQTERAGLEQPGPGPDGAKPYLEVDPPTRSRGELERTGWNRSAKASLSELIAVLVADCGPVSLDRLARRVVNTYGISRLTEQRVVGVREALPAELRRDPEEGFCWPPDRDPERWTGFRTSADLKDRPLSDIALREIGNAMVAIAGSAMGIATDELFKETFRLFGGSRLTEPVRERMAAALALAVRRGLVVERAGVISPVPVEAGRREGGGSGI